MVPLRLFLAGLRNPAGQDLSGRPRPDRRLRQDDQEQFLRPGKRIAVPGPRPVHARTPGDRTRPEPGIHPSDGGAGRAEIRDDQEYGPRGRKRTVRDSRIARPRTGLLCLDLGNVRYDSRDSFVHPSEGVVLQAEAEYAPGTGGTNVRFTRLAGWFQYYSVLFYPKTIFAIRLGGQSLFGDDLPSHVLLPLGGSRTLRGSPQDRYLDKSHLLMNAELRFPIFRRLGGVVGLDAGKVWPSLGGLDFRRWAANPVIGLRFTMSTFVVRMDIGLGRETTGFYFNFGHLF
ncbi:MAG: outer membrane protein assembly factor [Candidatus Aminicenantes bacterium]|nr:outer membrane protein assembly factor [Candidatus Aminicenantes bacterium]